MSIIIGSLSQISKLFQSGGPFMYPLAILSVITIAIVFERLLTEKKWRVCVNSFLSFVKKKESPLSSLGADWNLQLDYYALSLKEQEFVLQEKLQSIFDRRMRVNEVISTIGSSAPLLGFIGTVSGMISSFDAIASADKVSVKLVAGGISEALVTTGYGLIIAVVCVISESLLRYSFTKFSHSIEDKVNIMFLEEQEKLEKINS